MKYMKSFTRSIILIYLILCTTVYGDQTNANQSGSGMVIYVDVGGPPDGQYATRIWKGAKTAAKDLGCSIRFLYSDWNTSKMLKNFKASISEKPDGIVIMGHPGDDSYKPLVDMAFKEGIKVTSIDTDLPKTMQAHQSDGFGYAGPIHYKRGKSLAEEAVSRFKLGRGNKAIVWGLLNEPSRGLSTKAIIETLEAAGLTVDYMEIPSEVNKTTSLGTPLLKKYLSENPDCDLIVMDHGGLTAQIENFLKAANVRPDDIYAIGFSLSSGIASGIKKGYVDMTGDVQPFVFGYLGVVQIVMSQRYGFSGFIVDTGLSFIDRSNIEQIETWMRKEVR